MPLTIPIPALPSPSPSPANPSCNCGGDNGGVAQAPGCVLGFGSGLPWFNLSWPNFSGSCGCLSGDCLVALHNGELKPAREIAVGDLLVGPEPGGEERPQKIVQLWNLVQPTLRIVHAEGEFVCSESHVLVLATGAQMGARCLEPGQDELVSESGKSLAILRIERLGEAMVYGWTCEPDHVFYAAGLLHHNKASAVPAPVLVQ